jgi:transposase
MAVGYAPELNPVEHIWSYLKEHELPNLCPRELRHSVPRHAIKTPINVDQGTHRG